MPGPAMPHWREVADALWLAAVTGPSAVSPSTVEGRPEPAPAGPPEPARPAEGSASAAMARPPSWPAWRDTVARIEGLVDLDAVNGSVPALPGTYRLGQALRPFKRRITSVTETEPDEERSAEYAADTGQWLPQYRFVEARWLSLVLIVDGSPSMAVWRPTVAAFRAQLERHGSFRSVRTFVLSPGRSSLLGAGGGARSPAELLDSTGRQLFLVLTDGLSPLWTDQRTQDLLRLWGGAGPLAIVDPFPQQHWHRTALNPRRAKLHPARAAAPNSRLDVRYDASGLDVADAPAGLAVPMLELSPRWISWWARLVTEPTGWVDGVVHVVGSFAVTESADRTLDPDDLVLRFRSSVSATAFRLATYLAAAPLDLPLLRRIQRSLLPESMPLHLAEVVTSDLVRRTDGTLDFVDGVREALLACGTRHDSARVLRAVGGALTLTTPIDAPDNAPDPLVTRETLPLARIELAVLNALSGPYARRARRLSQAIAALDHGGPTAALDVDVPTAALDGGPTKPPKPESEAGGPATSDPIDEPAPGVPLAGPPEGGAVMPDRPDDTYPADDVIGPGEPLLPSDDPILSVQALLDSQSQETGPAVWGNVPTRNPVFTGRRELLEQLERRLQTESVAAVLPQALHGEGGVGKSQIAIEYAYRHRADYEVIWWIPSERPAQILASVIELGNRLGLDVGNEVITAVPRVRAALRAGIPYSNWLLVFDNAETLENVRDYFPEAGTGRVLVTSRNQEWSQIAETLEVDVFNRTESIRLLQRRNPRLEEAGADQLAAVLGDLPLAIEHASAWLATTGMPVEEYLVLLEQKRAELADVHPVPRYEMPVAVAANVALDRLATENLAALQLLQVCSFFAPEPISRELFAGPRTTPIAPELDEALQSSSQLNQAMRDIQKYVLARIDHRTDSLQLHRLVQAELKARMPESHRTGMEHGAHVLLAGGGKPGDPRDPTHWLRYQALASHVTASNAYACEDDWARELVLNLVAFYYYWGDYKSGRDLAQQVVDDWRDRLTADHPQTLRAAKWLGFFWWVEGDNDAASVIHRDTLDRYRRIAGADDGETIDAMGMVAATLRVGGRFGAARDLDLEAFQRARRLYGENDPDTLRAAHQLGVSLRLTGEFRTARQLDGDTYRRLVPVLGDDHPATLLTLNGLTIDVRECGEYIESHLLVERNYAKHVGLFGIGHPDTVRVARNLAVARRRAGDHEGAYKLAEDTVNRLQDRFGPEHPDTIAAQLDFAVDLRESDDLPRARTLAMQTAERYRARLGPTHPYTLYARTNLSIVHRLLGHPDDAYLHNVEARAGLERALGPNHVLTLTCGINLASDLSALGEHGRAHEVDAEILRRSRQMMGVDHPSTLACAVNLSFDLMALDRGAEGERLFDDAVAGYVRVLGSEHPAIVAANARVRANCDVDPMPF
ncbi:FxSxx-COOH system tetratricopeptide repeat protein [Virgisporangium aurantiacum]|uniref:Cytochrome c n=1 Tax=Virgisporangium aurantiacum TaxID=175570 RepID=A0A8J3Z0Z2_9ACTN|nr:FxSxx-COOH system tetratricopeptide repeat protein [Virgisporangium aurantiacum]GIJ53241.1 cytochrome c [Virgisporangium aurantiacum]